MGEKRPRAQGNLKYIKSRVFTNRFHLLSQINRHRTKCKNPVAKTMSHGVQRKLVRCCICIDAKTLIFIKTCSLLHFLWFLIVLGAPGSSNIHYGLIWTHPGPDWLYQNTSRLLFQKYRGGGGPRKVECLVTSHIQCFTGLFYSEPPRKVSADEQMFNMTFKILSNKPTEHFPIPDC